LAVNVTVDNTVIDFTAIQSLLQTVKSHDDLFVQFSSGSMGNIVMNETATTSSTPTTTASPIPASSFLMQGVQASGNLSSGTCTFTVYWGENFGGTPIVTATPQSTNSNSTAYAYVYSVDTTKAVIVVNDTGSSTGSVSLNVLALGVRSA